jgi:hypothetical protein
VPAEQPRGSEHDVSRFAVILIFTLAAASDGCHSGIGPSTADCPVTAKTYDRPPDDPNPFFPGFGYGNWYINADRTMWASAESRFERGEDKVLWIRPAGTQLIVTGRRLDAAAPPPRADIPCCYPSTFQASGLTFPTPGCWQVTAKAGTATLQFVVTAGPY